MNKIPFSVYDFFGYLASGFVVLSAYDFAFGLGWLTTRSVPPGMALLAVLLAYVTGHAVAHLSSVLIELYFLRGVLKSPEEHLLAQFPPTSRWRFLFPGNYAPLPHETQDRIRRKAKAAGVEPTGRALFFHCHPIVKRDQATLERLNTFLNLYGFCRNLSMGLVISAAILGVGALQRLGGPLPDSVRVRLSLASISLVGAYILLLRYLKFFRHYTLEVFISYAEASDS